MVEPVVARGSEWTATYQLDADSGPVVCALIVLLFGSHADRDPIRWWAGEALDYQAQRAPAEERTRMVHAALVRTLRRFARLTRHR
jgi:hypothetical protein